jgi:hypothetical protein
MSRQILMPVVEYDWRRWFAWRPVQLIDETWAWWRTIERRKVWFIEMMTEYRALDASPEAGEPRPAGSEPHV